MVRSLMRVFMNFLLAAVAFIAAVAAIQYFGSQPSNYIEIYNDDAEGGP